MNPRPRLEQRSKYSRFSRKNLFRGNSIRFLVLPLGRIEVEDYLTAHFGSIESKLNDQTQEEE
jgi:hypothetical protein